MLLEISGRPIGQGKPCFIVAEAGVNHNGRLERAIQLVDEAARCGADAVKFQTFKAENLSVPSAPKAAYQIQRGFEKESQFEMLKRFELPFSAFKEIHAHCKKKRILFLSTPFDEKSADFLKTLDVAAFKIASGEITHVSFLTHIAKMRKPMILSTGMSNLEEIRQAVKAVEAAGNMNYALLHCVSNYPARPEDMNLRAMETLVQTFNVPVGLSDHTIGLEITLAAVALGASIIEKHFTLSQKDAGPDHAFSLEPDEFAILVKGVRAVESALGNGCKEPVASEKPIALVVRKSIVAAKDIPAGTTLREEHIAIKRPGSGLPPGMCSSLIGKTAKNFITAGELLELEKFL